MVRAVGGVVTELKRQYTKKGDLMGRFVLEDLQASMEVFVFPRVMADYGALLENDAVVVVRGRIDLRDEQPKIVGHGDPAARRWTPWTSRSSGSPCPWRCSPTARWSG